MRNPWPPRPTDTSTPDGRYRRLVQAVEKHVRSQEKPSPQDNSSSVPSEGDSPASSSEG